MSKLCAGPFVTMTTASAAFSLQKKYDCFYLFFKALQLLLLHDSDVNVSIISMMDYCVSSERCLQNKKELESRQLISQMCYLIHQKSTDENVQETVKALHWEELDKHSPITCLR